MGCLIAIRFDPEENRVRCSAKFVKQLWAGSVSKVTKIAKKFFAIFQNTESIPASRFNIGYEPS